MVLEMRCCLLLLFACLPVMAGEKAAYDSNGRILSTISDAGEVEILQHRRRRFSLHRRGGVSLLGRRHAGAVRGVGRCSRMAGASAAGHRNGVDPSACYTGSYDSYEYGLREARMAQELLSYARPQGAQFWQFTDDYALACVACDGTVEPTARFWLMKHFTDLTPPSSDALTAASDQSAVLVTAFRNHRDCTVHILNLGAAREAVIGGLLDADWRVVETTEEAQFQEAPTAHTEAGALHLRLPPRSLVSLKSLAGEQSAD